MAADRGFDFLLREGAVAGTTLAGMRATGMTLNNEMVDVTTKDSAGARTLLAAAGIQSLTISASGVFTDAAVEETIRGYAFARSLNIFNLLFPNADTLQASFYISQYGRNGDYNIEEVYDITLESSGALTYA
jgi:TP901-1 family phage major tail protein|tara:strand:+ start:3362 stop:3757 length:396 start_codon:yes stop_codon:yes gene_type:complete